MDHIDLDPPERGDSRARAGEFLLVEVGEGVVRIPGATILEIMNPTPATPLPGAPPSVLGVVNYRGTPVPVVDLTRALERGVLGESPRVVVLRWKGREIALAVDDVLAMYETTEGAEPGSIVDLEALLGSIF